jgi:hypothetical protein
VTAVLRYQLALLARSHRWLPPALLYAVLVVAGSIGGMPLAGALGWSSAMLVPAVGWLTRSALTAEPAAARACLATAAGPRRAQLAALTAGLIGGAVLAILGGGFELAATRWPTGAARQAETGHLMGAGLAAGVTCLLIGSAIGALCNPPLIRHPAYGMLSTAVIAVTAIGASISPANAAIRATAVTGRVPSGLPLVPVGLALALIAVAWAVSVQAAARRSAG